MNITAEKTIREIAVEYPSTIRVFERFGIDYCCGGRKPLRQACDELRLSFEQVSEKIDETLATATPQTGPSWDDVTLSKIIQIIVRKHHVFTRQELPRLKALAAKVESRHGSAHPELAIIRERVERLEQEMFEHMEKEEHVLFTAIARAEHSLRTGADLPANPFGSLDNPIRRMMEEHDVAGELCAEIRRLSSGYEPPDGACPSYRGLYAGLQDFEKDLHQHVHLENNVLFVRATQLEANSGGAPEGENLCSFVGREKLNC